ncbi:unnamed protein product [Allacma fusca]|uniref:Uncharacterized protein n=1 Tax=Allacma fusca TaxID=39272 RepID=A0A8J2PI77_9HEXA|nr:unnamed protein product [Allacma fusca]
MFGSQPAPNDRTARGRREMDPVTVKILTMMKTAIRRMIKAGVPKQDAYEKTGYAFDAAIAEFKQKLNALGNPKPQKQPESRQLTQSSTGSSPPNARTARENPKVSKKKVRKAHDPYALEILKRIAPSRKKMQKAGVPKQKIAALVLSALKKPAGEVISTLLHMPPKALFASAMHSISSETKAPVKKIPPHGTKAPMKKPQTQETIAPVKKIPPQEMQASVMYHTPQETQAPVLYLPPSETQAPVIYIPPTEIIIAPVMYHQPQEWEYTASAQYAQSNSETQAPVMYLPAPEKQAPVMYLQPHEMNAPVMYNQPQEWEYASTAYAQSDSADWVDSGTAPVQLYSDYVDTSYVPAGATVPMDANIPMEVNTPMVSESQWTEPLPLERPITRISSDYRRQPIRRPPKQHNDVNRTLNTRLTQKPYTFT